MALVSMKLSPAEAKEESGDYAMGVASDPADQPAYPYGLTLDLDDETLAKLGITTLPQVGATMQLMALVEVSSVRESQNQGGSTKGVCLQVTDMSLEAGAPAARSADAISGSLYK